jgi:hypothetical protein
MSGLPSTDRETVDYGAAFVIEARRLAFAVRRAVKKTLEETHHDPRDGLRRGNEV